MRAPRVTWCLRLITGPWQVVAESAGTNVVVGGAPRNVREHRRWSGWPRYRGHLVCVRRRGIALNEPSVMTLNMRPDAGARRAGPPGSRRTLRPIRAGDQIGECGAHATWTVRAGRARRSIGLRGRRITANPTSPASSMFRNSGGELASRPPYTVVRAQARCARCRGSSRGLSGRRRKDPSVPCSGPTSGSTVPGPSTSSPACWSTVSATATPRPQPSP